MADRGDAISNPAPDAPRANRLPSCDPPIAFQLANFYSGATLLTLLLDAHRDIVSNGELFQGRSAGRGEPRCSCGEDLRECSTYRAVAGHLWTGTEYDPSLARWIPRFTPIAPLQAILATTAAPGRWKSRLMSLVPGASERSDAFVAAHREIARKAIELAGARVYLDGCKDLRRAELFLSRQRMPSPLVHMVRHPVSWVGALVARQGERASVDDLIASWRLYVDRAYRLADRYDAPLLTFAYEELCAHPARCLTTVCSHLGLPYDPAMLERHDPGQHHLLGNHIRFEFDGTVHEASERSGVLSEEDQARVRRACRDQMIRIGYD